MEWHRAARVVAVAELGTSPATVPPRAVVAMVEVTGHAAFHVKLKDAPRGSTTRKDRRGLLKESMRHLDSKDVQRFAAKTPSIVASESHLNDAFVNDGAGGFTVAAAVKEVLDYGDKRLKRVRRKITDSQVTVTTFVVHLPKTMCEEVPDYYPRYNPDGTERLDPATGEPMSRSRWVARDRDKAMRYIRDAITQLGGDVIPGGIDAIHGWATNFDESTPHIQVMANPFAPDPKAPDSQPDALRTEFNQAYGSHREVRDAKGRQLGVKQKLSGHQERFRAHMLHLGWPVKEKVSARHGKELSKSEYEATQDALAEARAQEQWTRELVRDQEDRERELNGARADFAREKESTKRAQDERDRALAEREKDNEEAQKRLDEGTRVLEEDRRTFEDIEMPRLRRNAVADGAREGREKGIEEAQDLLGEWMTKVKKLAAEQLRRSIQQQTPLLLDEFLDRKDKNGRSYRPIFERFVDRRLEQFAVQHDVAGEITLEPGDREQFIRDGGEILGAEVTQLKHERERDRGLGD